MEVQALTEMVYVLSAPDGAKGAPGFRPLIRLKDFLEVSLGENKAVHHTITVKNRQASFSNVLVGTSGGELAELVPGAAQDFLDCALSDLYVIVERVTDDQGVDSLGGTGDPCPNATDAGAYPTKDSSDIYAYVEVIPHGRVGICKT